MRPVQHLGRREVRDRLGVGEVHVAVARCGEQRSLDEQPRQRAAVDRHDVVLAGLDVPRADQRDQAVAVVGGDVLRLGEVLLDVVQLPARDVELAQRVRRDRCTERLLGLRERRARPRAHGAPAVVVDGTVADHLEVLGVMVAGGGRVVEGVREAHALDRRLRDALDGGRRLDAEQRRARWAPCR